MRLSRGRVIAQRLGVVAVRLKHMERWLSVRASSASTKLSKLSDSARATVNRGRIALTWLGCTATTAGPAFASRSNQRPVRPLQRGQQDSQTHQPRAQRPDPRLVVAASPALRDPAPLVEHAPPLAHHPQSLHPI
jgi:hypothetical protein